MSTQKEDMTLGVPKSLLIANGIDPMVLELLPAEEREEVLADLSRDELVEQNDEKN